MSAFLVDSDTIDYMICGAIQLGYASQSYGDWIVWDSNEQAAAARYVCPTSDLSRVGRELIRENLASVVYRYPGDDFDSAPGPIDKGSLKDYRYRPVQKTIDLATLAKSVNCYVYQSCEHPRWVGSQSQRFCQSVLDHIVRALPGYEEAPWGWRRTETDY